MKTKRLLLKLFLAVCLLMAVPPREAEAAITPSLSISQGNITISGGNTADPDSKDKIEQASNGSADLTEQKYTISGLATTNSNKIIVKGPFKNVGSVNLIFENLSARTPMELEIDNAIVNVTIKGAYNYLQGGSGNSAVTIKNGGQLNFSGSNDSCITITAGTTNTSAPSVAAVLGGGLNINSGRVILLTGGISQNVPFRASSADDSGIFISDGTLECRENDITLVNYGEGKLTQIGGTIKANGLAYVDLAEEKIKGLETDLYSFQLKDASGQPDYDRLGTVTNPSQDIKIPENWHTYYLSIAPTGENKTGVNQTLYIPDRISKKPSNLSVKAETVSGQNDGYISPVDSSMQYAKDKNSSNKDNYAPSDWKDCKAPEFDKDKNRLSLPPGTYRLRYKYIDSAKPEECKFASEPSNAALTIERANTLEASISSQTPYSFGSKQFQYEKRNDIPGAKSIDITNKDVKNRVTVTSVALTGDTDAFEVLGDVNDIDPEQTDDSWSIRPKGGLHPGNYKADVTINYYNNRNPENKESKTIENAVTFTVTRLPYNGDPFSVAPEVESKTFNSITLKPIVIEGNTKEIEYGKRGSGDTVTWQKDPTFTELDADTEYTFVARFAETTDYEASKEGPFVKETTEKKASIVYSSKQLSLIPNRKYRISLNENGKNWDYTTNSTGLIDIESDWFGNEIIIYDDDKKNTQTLKIPDITKAPTTPVGVAESFSGANDGRIEKVTTAMEYKLKDSTDNWTDCPGTSIKDLAAGTYLVRTKAVDEGTGENRKYTFASQAKEVLVPRGSALRITPAATEGIDFGKQVYKKAVDPKAISFTNRDTAEYITIKSITLSDNSPFTVVHKDTDSQVVDPGKTNSTFKIQPKADLNVGTYKDEFVVTYVYGYDPDEPKIEAQAEGFNADFSSSAAVQSEAIPVAFEVEKADQEAPPVPAEKNASSTSITLEKIANSAESGAKAQYSKDSGSTWQDSPTFTRLKEDTEYYFVARYAETENYNQSEPSAGEAVIATTKKGDDDDDQNMNSNANGNGTNGSNGSGTNGSGTNGSSTNGTTGTNGTTTGTNGTNGTTGSGTNSNSSNRGVSAARTGDLNNIQLWITLLIGSYLSCAYIIWSRIRKAKSL